MSIVIISCEGKQDHLIEDNHMREISTSLLILLLLGCTAPPKYTWQDTRQPIREDPFIDLQECRDYSGRQYQPGIPAGEPFLKAQAPTTEGTDIEAQGEWRPDRSPFHTTNVNAQPTHDVPVAYTGFPGELDYYPDYLDDILEKCMRDRGWVYRPETASE
jgi:hypothetical protein